MNLKVRMGNKQNKKLKGKKLERRKRDERRKETGNPTAKLRREIET